MEKDGIFKTIDTKSILKDVRKLHTDKTKLSFEELKSKYKKLYNSSKTLFDCVVEKNMKPEDVAMFLDVMDNAQNHYIDSSKQSSGQK
jgi:hypothetical protein